MRYGLVILLPLLGVFLTIAPGCGGKSEEVTAPVAGDAVPPSGGVDGGGAPEAPGAPSGSDYVPLIVGTTYAYEGEAETARKRVEVLVSHAPRQVLGIPCTEVVNRVFLDGELKEETISRLAKAEDGAVRIMGRVRRTYENETVVHSEGWEAGIGGAEPGVLLNGTPRVGDVSPLEISGGVAVELAEVVALDTPVRLSDGRSYRCLKTRQWDPSNSGDAEFKYYAPGVGLVLAERADGSGSTELVETAVDTDPRLDPADFVPVIDNPYLPFLPGTALSYRGEWRGRVVTIEVLVSTVTKQILDIPCTVVDVNEYLDGRLEEKTTDWYAQDVRGDVWYLGEATAKYENGVVVSTAGSWEAGVDGAMPGIVMKGTPRVGDSYRSEFSPGVAEDTVEVVAMDVPVTLESGREYICLQTREWSPLDPEEIEYKYYAPGEGMVAEELVSGGERMELEK